MNVKARMVYFNAKVFQNSDSASLLPFGAEGWKECFQFTPLLRWKLL